MNEGPPVLIGEKVFWLGSGSGLPKRGKVKWLGKLAEMGPGWAVGVELEEELPYGGIDGSWGTRKLFDCKHKHGLIVPASSLVSERRYLQSVIEEGTVSPKERQLKEEKKKKDYSLTQKKNNASTVTPRKNNAFLPVGSSLQRPNENQAGGSFEATHREYLTQPRGSDLQVQQGVVYSWMVDHRRQNDRLFFRRMDFTRREFNRSLDDGLAFESPRNSYHSSRSAGTRNRSSGIFALFKWFKKEKSEEESDLDVSSGQTSPVLPRTTSITGSVDTLFSTATANSFAYVHPLQYRPFGLANQPEIRIAVGPETNTYRNRIRERERLRYLDRNISLREKYRLYASGTLPRSVDHIHELADEGLPDLKASFETSPESRNSTLGRKKRKAPAPPKGESSSNSASNLNEIFDLKQENKDGVKQHRRTLSEPVKYNKVCHVKGKRKAPPPPGSSTDPDVISISTTNSNSSKRSRKKRRAPSPPIQKSDHSKSNGIVNIIREATNGILDEELGAVRKEEAKEETASTASTVDICSSDVVCTDTLKLERGILKPNMDKPFTEPKICPSSPVSPRPWYKRPTSKELGSFKDKDKKKEKDRRKVEDWMLESGFPRRSFITNSNNDSRYNIFARTDKADDKRKSQISILTNISELDREAAEIIRRGKERERNLIDSHNAMYYDRDTEVTGENVTANELPNESPRKNSAKELISLFNAITNVTKVTVNSSFFSKEVSNIFNKDGKEKKVKTTEDKYIKGEYEGSNSNQFIEIESLDEVVHRSTTNLSENGTAEDDKPGSSSSQASSSGKIARVTIEELDEYDAERNSKSQVLYEANKQNRHLSPPIPTITEVSEGSAKSSPTSTIASNTSDLPPDVPTEVQAVPTKPTNVWICPRCTLENLRWRITCEACEMWRPNPYELREKANKECKATTQATHKQEPNKVTSGINLLYPNLSPLKTPEITTSSSTNKELNNKGIQKIEKTKDLEGKLSSRPRVDEIPLVQNRVENKITHEKEEKVNSNLKNETKIVINDKNKPEKAMEPEKITKETTAKKTESNHIHAQMIKGKEETVSVNIKENSTNQNIEIKKENIIKNPGIEFKNDLEMANKVKKPEGPTGQQLASEEVRKARIAFFDKTKPEGKEMEAQFLPKQEETKLKSGVKEKDKDKKENLYKEERTSYVEKNSESIVENRNISSQSNQNKKTEAHTPTEQKKHQVITLVDDDDEKKKLKEMLIEMKHSLPKRPKPVKKSEKGNSSEESLGENKNFKTQKPEGILEEKDSPQMQGASCSNQQNSIIKPYVRPPSDEKAVAYLIQSETIVEEIKMKKPSEKVSSSVQTSGLVTQITPKSKPTPGKEILIPINIEEHVIKDGILYTSFTKDTRKIGTGTFELMRPRDFASIKDIKTDAKQGLPLYANMTDDDSNVSVKSEEATVNSSAYIDKLSKQLVRPQGVANFRARLDLNNDKNMNTLAVNRLLKRLENAIAGGNHELAAALARELAQLKVNCSVIRQKSQTPDNELLLELYVEDKISHQGPFPLKVKSTITVGELKEVVEREYEIPIRVQRWILGKQLAGDDSATLQSLGVNTDGSPIFLYLVAPELNIQKTDEVIEIEVKPSTSGVVIEEIHENPEENIVIKEETPVAGPSGVSFTTVDKVIPEAVKTDLNPTGTLALGWKCEICTLMNSPTRPGCVACSANRPESYQVPEHYKISETEMERIHKEVQNDEQSAKAVEEEKVKNYQKLVDLEKDDLIIYPEGFECSVCLVEYEPNEGVVLRECLHVFCRTCLANTIHFSDEAEVKCPFRDNNYTCDSTLLEREIKALVTPQAYEEHLAKSIALAETKIGNAFHCKTPDCKGWCIYEDNVNIFRCPVCTHTNCLTCQAIHEGLNCKQFQEQLNNNSDMNIESKRTKEMLQEMVDRGEAMNCPTCQVVLMKKWGCDWLRCSMCKTEICWITRGPRWGPNGKGDTSGGCQCGVNGIKCHPKCTYCH